MARITMTENQRSFLRWVLIHNDRLVTDLIIEKLHGRWHSQLTNGVKTGSYNDSGFRVGTYNYLRIKFKDEYLQSLK